MRSVLYFNSQEGRKTRDRIWRGGRGRYLDIRDKLDSNDDYRFGAGTYGERSFMVWVNAKSPAPDVILAHEVGHGVHKVIREVDVDRMFENTYRAEMGYDIRDRSTNIISFDRTWPKK